MDEVDSLWSELDGSITSWKEETLDIWSELNDIKQSKKIPNDFLRQKRQIYTNYEAHTQRRAPPKYIAADMPYYNSYSGYESYNPINNKQGYQPPIVEDEPKEMPVEEPACGMFILFLLLLII